VATRYESILFVNAILHVLSSVATRGYSPGLATGVVLNLPPGRLAPMRAR